MKNIMLETVKNKNFWLAIIILLIGLFPEAEIFVTKNFSDLNSLLGAVLAMSAASDAKKKVAK